MNYQAFEYVGYVYRRRDSKYGIELYLKSMKDEASEKYPQHICVTVSKKSESKVDPTLAVGDKVKAKLIPTLNEGVSERTQKAYAINKLNLNEIEILERADPSEAQGSDAEVNQEDLPF
jgi:hypothetical protein